MKKIILNQEKCIGCGACVAVSPKNFDFNDEGLSTIISDEVTNETIEASEICPVMAIEITGDCCCENCQCDNDTHECDCEDCQCDKDIECNCGCNCCANEKNIEN